MSKNELYPELRLVFSDFLKAKSTQNRTAKALQEASHSVRLPQPGETHTHIIEQLGLSTEAFYQQYISPWSRLTPEQLIAVVHHWNMVNAPEKHLLMEVTPTYENLAIHWTLVNISKLNLFDVFLPEYMQDLPQDCPESPDWLSFRYGGPAYALPYKQCGYCGRLNTDPRGKAFGKQDLFFCHVLQCPSSDPNPSSHRETCCYRAWQSQKVNLKKRLDRNRQDSEKVAAIFLEFCEQRYIANQNMRLRVQVQQEKPYDWIRPSDYLSLSIYKEPIPLDNGVETFKTE